MSAAIAAVPPVTHSAAHATGPKTPAGKAVSARNAVTHGLHAQDAVLPHLGESQAEYNALCDGLARELSPRTAVERHYVAQIAQAMWRLRRLTRWEAGLYDDPALTDDERITKMARVLRHDAALRRHIDRAIKALSGAPAICQNEPAHRRPASPASGEVASLGEPEGVLHAICQNEPAPAPNHPLRNGEVSWLANSEGSPAPPELGAGGQSFPPPIRISALRKARQQKAHKKCQNEPV